VRRILVAEAALQDAAQADAELSRLREENRPLVIQLVSMKRRPNVRAVEMIAAQTLRAKEKKAMIATKPEVDILLRLAGTTQISEAIERAGYRAEGTKFLIAAGGEKWVRRLESCLAQGARRRRYTILKGDELDARAAATVERAALLGTRN